MQQQDEFGIVTGSRLRAAFFAARHPHLERKINGKAPVFLNAKNTRIEVDLKTGRRLIERSVEVVPAPPPPPKPRPTYVPPPVAVCWHTPEGKRELAKSEAVEAMADRVRVGDIINAVAQVTGISAAQICGVSRQKAFAHPRHLAMLLCKELRPDLSLPKIGFLFGNRDHTTVMLGQRAAVERVDTCLMHKEWYERARLILAEKMP